MLTPSCVQVKRRTGFPAAPVTGREPFRIHSRSKGGACDPLRGTESQSYCDAAGRGSSADLEPSCSRIRRVAAITIMRLEESGALQACVD
jgi:hypothetical protein